MNTKNDEVSLKLVNQHIKYISPRRISSYLGLIKKYNETETHEHRLKAILLYSEFQNISKLYFHIIQEIEISLRNTASEYIQKFLKQKSQSTKFYNNDFLLKCVTGKNGVSIKEVVQDIKDRNNRKKPKKGSDNLDISNDDIIAKLSLGFWVNIFNDDTSPKFKNDLTTFFFKTNDPIFNGNFNSISDVYTQLSIVLRFRNRLFHQEPIWKSKGIKNPRTALEDMAKKYKIFCDILMKIAPERHVVINGLHSEKEVNDLFNYSSLEKRIDLLEKHLLE